LPTLVQMVSSGARHDLPAGDGGERRPDRFRDGRHPADRPAHASREIVVAWRAGSNRAAEGRLLAEVLRE